MSKGCHSLLNLLCHPKSEEEGLVIIQKLNQGRVTPRLGDGDDLREILLDPLWGDLILKKMEKSLWEGEDESLMKI